MRNKFNFKKLKKIGVIQLVNSSTNMMESYSQKSKESLLSSKFLFEKTQYNDAIVLSYFSMYNSLLSLLYLCGIKSENHNVSIFLLQKIFGIDNKSIENAKSGRKDKQYYPSFSTNKKEVSSAIEIAEEFNAEIGDFVVNLNSQKIEGYKNRFRELIK